MNDITLTVIVPAKNEECNLPEAIAAIMDVAPKHFVDFEILIFDDNSTDGTSAVAHKLADANPHIRVIRNTRTLNLGGVMREGLKTASMSHVIRVNGSGTEKRETLERIFAHKGEADIVIPWLENMDERHWVRKQISFLYRWILNTSFGLNLKYYNHSFLCRTELLRAIHIRTSSYAYPSEAVIKLLGAGYSFVEVPVRSRYDGVAQQTTKAFRLKNVIGIASFYLRTVWDVHFRNKPLDKPATN